MAGRGEGEELRGAVVKVLHGNPDGWGVLVVENGEEEIKVTGHVGHVGEGESGVFSGEWTNHPRFGRQFKATGYRRERPATAKGIERYLARIEGIGPVIASALVAAFGADALQTIEREPDRLRDVPGVGAVRASSISQAVLARTAMDEAAIQLTSYGVPQRFVAAIVKRFGPDAIEQVKRDPYRLIGMFGGIGFKTADQVAKAVGVPLASEQRIAAGILHVVNESAAGDGHTYLPEGELLVEASKLLLLRQATIAPVVEVLDQGGLVVVEEGGVYARRLHAHEVQVAGRLREISTAPSRPTGGVGDAEHQGGLELSDDQQAAVRAALSDEPPYVLVVTGGPGTGKTTVTRLVVENYLRAGLSVRLAAPTGRAARRLAEATGCDASTIHRLLEYSPVLGGFARNRNNKIDADVVVVDEASMVDISLARHLLQAVPDQARLVLVGDADQLPSVGPGRVLSDVIDAGTCSVVRLQHVFRQALDSLIVVNAHRINTGRPPEEPEEDGTLRDFYMVHVDDPAAAAEMVVKLVTERIPERFGFDPMKDVQVLVPMNKGDLGTRELNLRLQAALNPNGRQVGNRAFRVGDRVMVTRNNYTAEVFNGDSGVIVDWLEEEKAIAVDFADGRGPVLLDGAGMSDLVLAYACTIHKSQGSEYPAVVLVCHSQHWIMLQRNLLYTGMTRARKLLALVGTDKAVRQAARRVQGAERHSRLALRLQQPDFGRRTGGGDTVDGFKEERWECRSCGFVFAEKQPAECPECHGSDLVECQQRR